MVKKILVISRHFRPENTRINELCRAFADADIRTDVLCGKPSGEDGEFLPGYHFLKNRRESFGKVSLYRCFDVRKGNGSNLRIFLNCVTFPLGALLKLRRLKHHSYDAVFVFQSSSVLECLPGVRAAKKQKIPLYINVVSVWPQSLYAQMDVRSGLFRKILQAISLHYYRKADRLIVPSEEMQGYFAGLTGISKERLPVVTHVPLSSWEQPFPKEHLMERFAGSFTLFMGGGFASRLSAETLTEAAKMVRKSSMRNVRFVIAGKGEAYDRLKAAVQKANLQDWFYLEGHLPSDVIGAYAYVADVMLGVSEPEETDELLLPQELINYLAAGKPVLISLSGLVRRLVRTAGCGYTTEPHDAKGIFEGISKLYRMAPEERARLGQNAREYQQIFHNPGRNAEDILSILRGELPLSSGKDTAGIRSLQDL